MPRPKDSGPSLTATLALAAGVTFAALVGVMAGVPDQPEVVLAEPPAVSRSPATPVAAPSGPASAPDDLAASPPPSAIEPAAAATPEQPAPVAAAPAGDAPSAVSATGRSGEPVVQLPTRTSHARTRAS